MFEQLYPHIRLINPVFGSKVVETALWLNQLREELFRFRGTTPAHLFFQMRDIFDLMETVGSARIEGNRTTVSEYADRRVKVQNKKKLSKEERFMEILNLEEAMKYIRDNPDHEALMTHTFIRDIHSFVVKDLKPPPDGEGDVTPGKYRNGNVEIIGATHIPPDLSTVHSHMNELLAFINRKDMPQYDLLKIALYHHRFCWIHPFTNGNGRVVRLLTYALLIKFGFSIKNGILNPAAVFCTDRDMYYSKLATADKGTDTDLEEWCQYVLSGFQKQFEKVRSITNFEILKKDILLPALAHGAEKSILSPLQFKILKKCLDKPEAILVLKDMKGILPELNEAQRKYRLHKILNEKFLIPAPDMQRSYTINFTKSSLMRSLLFILYEQGYAPGLENV